MITTREELREIIYEAVEKFSQALNREYEKPDSMDIDTAVCFLSEKGYHTSKDSIYKLTAKGVMPFKKYGKRLIFSRNELLKWVEQKSQAKI